MPSPIGHSLIAYALYRVTVKRGHPHTCKILITYLFVVCAADLDFIPGLFVGDVNRYHHGISHSIGFAVLFGFIFGLYLFLLQNKSPVMFFAISTCLYSSHVVLDYFSIDTSFPFGVPFFWPWTAEYYICPVSFFTDIERGSSFTGFIMNLASLHNLWAVIVEFLLLLPLVYLISIWKKRKRFLFE